MVRPYRGMPNEAITEDIVREHFKNDPLFDQIVLEEKASKNKTVKECLKDASKNKSGKVGFPDFIISFPAFPDDLIVIECKAEIKQHKSKDDSKPKEYAVDGACHYAKFLAKKFNVMAIGVSGNKDTGLLVSSLSIEKGQAGLTPLGEVLPSVYGSIKFFQGSSRAALAETEKIEKTAVFLNSELNSHSVPEYERCNLVSAILLALYSESFRESYKAIARAKIKGGFKPTPKRLASSIVNTINHVLYDQGIDEGRTKAMKKEYNKLRAYNISTEIKIKKKNAAEEEDNYVLRDLILELESNVLPFMEMGESANDVLGRFYTEFVRHAGTDKKTGLVLTPKHITQVLCDFLEIGKNDVVVDTCCGTGGFLISAMKKMTDGVDDLSEPTKKREIQENQIIGMEKRPDMFTFACANMIMSGDGKSHIYKGDSSKSDGIEKLKLLAPNVALLNPPYDVGDDGQLRFVNNALDILQPNGRLAALVQMSCATNLTPETIAIRKKILEQHKLNAVFSLPTDLFHQIAGVVTCAMIFSAHTSHPQGYESFFGYYRDDGHIKTKHRGRVPGDEWDDIKDEWVNLYSNRTVKRNLSLLKEVSAEDEWCAEAYMTTDYTKLSTSDFERAVREYVAYEVLNG